MMTGQVFNLTSSATGPTDAKALSTGLTNDMGMSPKFTGNTELSLEVTGNMFDPKGVSGILADTIRLSFDFVDPRGHPGIGVPHHWLDPGGVTGVLLGSTCFYFLGLTGFCLGFLGVFLNANPPQIGCQIGFVVIHDLKQIT